MVRVFGNFKLDGGFELTSKHDVITGVITIVLLLIAGFLGYTGHLTGAISTAITGGIGMMFSYWFARGGQLSQQNAQPQTVVQSVAQDVAPVVTEVLNQIAQQPPKAGATNAGAVSGNSSN